MPTDTETENMANMILPLGCQVWHITPYYAVYVTYYNEYNNGSLKFENTEEGWKVNCYV